MSKRSSTPKSSTATTKKSAKKPAPPRTKTAAPRKPRDQFSFLDDAEELPDLTWPGQLDLVKESCRIAIKACADEEEGVLLGRYLIEVGLHVVQLIEGQQMMVVTQDTAMQRLLTAIGREALATGTTVTDVVEVLVDKLSPDHMVN